MEHDDEMSIRKKVLAYEQVPSAWDKERAWSSVFLPGGQRSFHRIAVYYAAASLMLSAAIVISSLEFTHRRELEVRLAEIEWQIKSSRASTSKSMDPVTQESACPESTLPFPQERPTARRARPMKASEEKAQPVESVTSDATESFIAVTNDSETKPIASSEATPIVVAESAVTDISPPQVILGRSIPPASATKHDRFTLRLFIDDHNKNLSPVPAAPVTTLAGIHN